MAYAYGGKQTRYRKNILLAQQKFIIIVILEKLKLNNPTNTHITSDYYYE